VSSYRKVYLPQQQSLQREEEPRTRSEKRVQCAKTRGKIKKKQE